MEQLYKLLQEILWFGGTAALLGVFLSPIQYLKILKQETHTPYSTILSQSIKRKGIKILFCSCIPFAQLNFLINGAFGIAYYISDIILAENSSAIISAITRAVLGSIIETLLTVNTEVREITRNKLEYMHKKGRVASIVLPGFLRNMIPWFAAAFAHEISIRTDWNGFVLSFALGLIAGIISTPLDVMVTQSCGAQDNMSMFSRMKIAVQTKGIESVYAGTAMRILQIVAFVMLTEWVMKILSQ